MKKSKSNNGTEYHRPSGREAQEYNQQTESRHNPIGSATQITLSEANDGVENEGGRSCFDAHEDHLDIHVIFEAL